MGLEEHHSVNHKYHQHHYYAVLEYTAGEFSQKIMVYFMGVWWVDRVTFVLALEHSLDFGVICIGFDWP